MTNPLGVVPDDLDRFAATLTERASEAQAAAEYCNEWLSLPSGPIAGSYRVAVETIENLRAELVANYERLAALADGSMLELAATAQRYRVLEEASAAEIARAGS